MNGELVSSVMVAGKVVVVAVKASKEIPRSALVWALTHVVQPGDSIKLLIVIPDQSESKKLWRFSRLTSDCTTGHGKSLSGTPLDQRDDVSDLCAEMMLQLHHVYDPEKIKIRVKVVSSSSSGVVAAEVKKAQSNWIILDKHLKHEEKSCMGELKCNVVVMKRSGAKVLHLNLTESPMMEPQMPFSFPFNTEETSKDFNSKHEQVDVLRGPFVTPASSPEHESSLTPTDVGTSSVSSSEPGTSPFFVSGTYGNLKKEHSYITEENLTLYDSESDLNHEKLAPSSTRLYFQPWMDDILNSSGELTKNLVEGINSRNDTVLASTYKNMLENLSKLDREPDAGVLNYRTDINLSKSVREAISLSTNAPLGPPPLCSVCLPNRFVDCLNARLFAKGYTQVPGLDYYETFCPVIKAIIVHVVLLITVSRRWSLHQVDVKNDFLNYTLTETICMEQSFGYIDPCYHIHVYKLKKALYGLK